MSAATPPTPPARPKTTDLQRPKMRFAEAIAGGTAGALTVLLLHPLETVKTVLQSTHGLKSHREAFRTLFNSGGAGALYRGVVPALIGAASAWAIYFQTAYALRGGSTPGAALAPGGFSRDFAVGTAAGVVSAVLTNPIWVVKTRLQLHEGRIGAAAAARAIARSEGFRAFYTGLAPSIWLVMNGAIHFTIYERVKDALRSGVIPALPPAVDGSTSPAHSLLASTMSKLVASVATYPLQVVRTRMQEKRAVEKGYASMPKAGLSVLKTEGVRGFYRGLTANVARVLPSSAITFVTYEQVLAFLHRI